MFKKSLINLQEQYLITQWLDVLATRGEAFEKALENQSLSVLAILA
ncbi:hypothetical protein SSABA_v1c01200 [Spiroplasma sabaudiense Ar-1343]|uniref:Uncharacterized protein n=1 Tax=Spiroplasma sabaudiense Ar-1343 TaxID=1276257 RepID=W6A943_9MOLU|nr:hypothetical protein [Spiroplasma sabaudiense]AHI53532.1 hypothetical protein SSABA_v1c01200 [Spiroplasma sabaudiense Ar-1343]